jgi:hypothetical protein
MDAYIGIHSCYRPDGPVALEIIRHEILSAMDAEPLSYGVLAVGVCGGSDISAPRSMTSEFPKHQLDNPPGFPPMDVESRRSAMVVRQKYPRPLVISFRCDNVSSFETLTHSSKALTRSAMLLRLSWGTGWCWSATRHSYR